MIKPYVYFLAAVFKHSTPRRLLRRRGVFSCVIGLSFSVDERPTFFFRVNRICLDHQRMLVLDLRVVKGRTCIQLDVQISFHDRFSPIRGKHKPSSDTGIQSPEYEGSKGNRDDRHDGADDVVEEPSEEACKSIKGVLDGFSDMDVDVYEAEHEDERIVEHGLRWSGG